MKTTTCQCGWKFYNNGATKDRLCPQCSASVTVQGMYTVAEVKERVTTQRRLISWLIIFRRKSDRGIGDTAERMFLQAKADDREIKSLLKRLLSSCNCRTEDAADYLNKQYPYTRTDA